jgi:integrase
VKLPGSATERSVAVPVLPRPRGLGLPRPQRRDYVYLTHAQALALAAEAGRGRLLILLLVYTGLRWGEATALRVCDIDLDRRRVDVRRAFSDVGGRVILGTPNRISPVPSRCPGSWPSSWQPPLSASTLPSSCSPLPAAASCGRPTGGARSSSLPAAAPVSATGFRVHDLRHTAASLMIQAGYPPKMLQEIMGHASITTTLDLYGHLYPGEMDRNADRLHEAAGMTDVVDDAAKCGQMTKKTTRTTND